MSDNAVRCMIRKTARNIIKPRYKEQSKKLFRVLCNEQLTHVGRCNSSEKRERSERAMAGKEQKYSMADAFLKRERIEALIAVKVRLERK